ncbi:MAG: hypothetical protein R6V46_12590 [Desulfatiglandaceae bacterium]|jgi:hypothetical protein
MTSFLTRFTPVNAHGIAQEERFECPQRQPDLPAFVPDRQRNSLEAI